MFDEAVYTRHCWFSAFTVQITLLILTLLSSSSWILLFILLDVTTQELTLLVLFVVSTAGRNGKVKFKLLYNLW